MTRSSDNIVTEIDEYGIEREYYIVIEDGVEKKHEIIGYALEDSKIIPSNDPKDKPKRVVRVALRW